MKTNAVSRNTFRRALAVIMAVCLLVVNAPVSSWFALPRAAGSIAYTLGDVDADGVITAADSRLALRASVELESYAAGSREFLAADVDGNNKLTAGDARLILRAAVGLTQLPANETNTAPGGALQLSLDGDQNVSVNALGMYGMKSFDFAITADDGVVIKKVKKSADIDATVSANNAWSSEANKSNGKFGGYFKYELWELNKWEEEAKKNGEELPDGFNPNNLNLGTIVIDASAAQTGAKLYITGTVNEVQTVHAEVEVKTAIIPGDVNGEDGVTAADSRLTLRASVGLEDYAAGSREFLAADVDGNNKITAGDARLILRSAVGLTQLPANETNTAPGGTLQLSLNGENNVFVAVVNMIGLKSFDLVITADDGVIVKNVKKSIYEAATVSAGNNLVTEFNKTNGKFAGYFKEELWNLNKWTEEADDNGEEIPADFNPNNLDLGNIVLDVSAAQPGAKIYVSGTVNEVQNVNAEIEVISSVVPVVPGDVDGDGKVTAADSRLTLRASVELETFAADSEQFLAADVDGNNQLTAGDARLILRSAVGLTELPANETNTAPGGALQLSFDGNQNVSVNALGMYGMKSFDFAITADDGVVIKKVKKSADIDATVSADNTLSTEANVSNGKFAGYFKDALWERNEWKTAAENNGETLPDGFDPNNLNLGTIVIDASAAEPGAKLYITGTVNEVQTVHAEVEVKTSVRLGDVDNDGDITAADSRLALRASVELETFAADSAQFLAADVDGNNKITAGDARLILRAAVALTQLPSNETNTAPGGKLQLSFDGNKNVSLNAVSMIGLKSFDLVITADGGIILKNVKQSVDAAAASSAGNYLTTEKNTANGKFAGYFKEELWNLNKWKEEADDNGEDLPAGFDPNNLNLGTIVIDASAATGSARICVSGTVNEVQSVSAEIIIKTAEETTTRPPEPTTKAPEPTTKAPEPTTKKPEPTTKKPEPTTKAPEPTTITNYVISYSANGETEAPAAQTKGQGAALVLSAKTPIKSYKLTYNANGGSVSPAEKTVQAAFVNWNTKADGSGKSYTPGATYSDNVSVTLYAQWTEPEAGNLATPTRNGYTFDGWYTAANGGIQITASTVITKSQTLYAHWKEAVAGDVSGDGNVAAEDARLALRAAVGLEKYEKGSPEFIAADADKNNVLEAADARLILRAAVGLEKLP